MNKLLLFDKNKLNNILKKRSGETKFGEHIQMLSSVSNIYEQLVNLDVDYVLFGISEDVGVYASNGKPDTSLTWESTIKNLLNTQSNAFTNPSRVLVLGKLDFNDENSIVKSYYQNKTSDLNKAKNLVSNIDKIVAKLVHDIIKAGKKPIIIGGSQSNAYGNIKGMSLAHNSPINVINFDVEIDFNSEDKHHSNNSFSLAYTDGYLDKYFAFGLHESYINKNTLSIVKKIKKHIQYNTFEALKVRRTSTFKSECSRALKFITNKPFGIELDCKAIAGMPSNFMTNTGFSPNKTREFLHYFASHKNASYLHISEAALNLGSKKLKNQYSSLIGYLITDFIYSNGS